MGWKVEDFDAEKYMAEGEKAPPPPEEEDEDEPEPEFDEETKAVVAKADEARTAFDEADRKLRELDAQIQSPSLTA